MDADRIEFIKERLQQKHHEKFRQDEWLLLSYAVGLAGGCDIPIEIINYIDELCRN